MRPILPVLLKDFYKVGHKFQCPKNTTLVYSNLTHRAGRNPNSKGVIAFGFQYFRDEFLIRQFNEGFFQQDRDVVVKAYKRRIDNALGPGVDVTHIGELHELGYLPLKVKALTEGTFVPYRVPLLTLYNTDEKFFWLTNMTETIMSSVLWRPITSATTAFEYRKRFELYAKKTGADLAFVPWQGHDFSFRGMDPDAAIVSGAAHLLSFTGTDTIPAIDFLEMYYGADSDKELVGGSVPATEHSVMSMGLKDGEFETFKRLITEVYQNGIVSIVSDTWDFWKVLTEYLPRLKSAIIARNGKVVIRPDSGDPVKIICGDPDASFGSPQHRGAIQVLFEVFGGSVTDKGYIVLDPHIGLIYGDSITPDRQHEILSKLSLNGFASSNVVLGIGSYTYQYVTRDTHGIAMKATYGEISGVGQAIFKEPKTDDGTKNSAKGLLKVENVEGDLELIENVTWAEEQTGELDTLFYNSKPISRTNLASIRRILESYL